MAASKPNGRFLEFGTGTGLTTAWILDGMNETSTLISIYCGSKLLEIAQKHLGKDTRLSLECIDSEAWVKENVTQKFDYNFADTWHGKYLMLDEVLEMLNIGGLYIKGYHELFHTELKNAVVLFILMNDFRTIK